MCIYIYIGDTVYKNLFINNNYLVIRVTSNFRNFTYISPASSFFLSKKKFQQFV